MSAPLNIVALISGGKDSLYSILHCVQNGYNVVALANLLPTLQHKRSPDSTTESQDDHDEEDDINSFMYQTVGYSVVPYYARAMNLPLYRREITGTAAQTGRNYAYTPDGSLDETEDLVPLLQEVKRNHPEVNAICSGAILSTYQRTRIESVSLRLGLTPLAYLWQYPALPPPAERKDSITGLLDDMAAAGCDARIIKVASGGVKESLLGVDVAAPKTRNMLVSSMLPFFEDHELWLRGAVLGEGGEFETLAVSGPAPVWKKRIRFDETKSIVRHGEGGTSHLKLGDVQLVESERTPIAEKLVRIPTLLDDRFARLQKDVFSVLELRKTELPSQSRDGIEHFVGPPRQTSETSQNLKPQPEGAESDHWPRASLKTGIHTTTISNLTAPSNESPASQMQHITQQLHHHLTTLNANSTSTPLSPSHIVSTTLLLRSISTFAALNLIYATLFPSPKPPSRVTIALGSALPSTIHTSLSVILSTHPPLRGLHVQSRSYWAPANIGPYSQAISTPLFPLSPENENKSELVHVAGQIPLVPHTMELLQGSFLEEAVLALQHLWRVGQERGVDAWMYGVAYVPTFIKSTTPDALRMVGEVWRRANAVPSVNEDEGKEDDDDDNEQGPDAWDRRFNPYHHHHDDHSITNRPRKPSGTHLHPLPNPAFVAADGGVPPLLVVEVEALPREASVEWHSFGVGSLELGQGVRMEGDGERREWGTVGRGFVFSTSKGGDGEEEGERERERAFVTVQVRDTGVEDLRTVAEEVGREVRRVEQGTVYLAGHRGQQLFGLLEESSVQGLAVVPCYGLWGAAEDSTGDVTRLLMGIVFQRTE